MTAAGMSGGVTASMGPRPFSRGNRPERNSPGGTQPASMGPRPFSRGNFVWCGPPQSPTGFNGATAFQPWKCHAVGPDPNRSLQWGHGLSAVEIAARLLLRNFMWPVQWGHGLSAVEIYQTTVASHFPARFNGATAFQPWKPDRGQDAMAFGWQDRLQWGHGLSAVEIQVSASCSPSAGALQWGHGLSAVETATSRVHRLAHVEASMGPRPFSRGNRPRPLTEFAIAAELLQLGDGVSSRGNSPPLRLVPLTAIGSFNW